MPDTDRPVDLDLLVAVFQGLTQTSEALGALTAAALGKSAPSLTVVAGQGRGSRKPKAKLASVKP